MNFLKTALALLGISLILGIIGLKVSELKALRRTETFYSGLPQKDVALRLLLRKTKTFGQQYEYEFFLIRNGHSDKGQELHWQTPEEPALLVTWYGSVGEHGPYLEFLHRDPHNQRVTELYDLRSNNLTWTEPEFDLKPINLAFNKMCSESHQSEPVAVGYVMCTNCTTRKHEFKVGSISEEELFKSPQLPSGGDFGSSDMRFVPGEGLSGSH